MSQDNLEEPWYRCVRCRAMFKLKSLIIRHLILHKVHRFENDSDTKCSDDWERVRVTGGGVVKVEIVDLPKEETLSQSGLEFHQIHNHQQTSWILESATDVPSPTGTTTLTLITVNNGANVGSDSTSYHLGPFDPIISQTFLKFENEGGPIPTGTGIIEANSNSHLSIGGPGIDFPTTESLYRCRYCSAPFAHSRSRAVHEAKVHNEEMVDAYTCQKCKRNFPTIASVQDHYRCTHKVTPPVKKAWKLWKTHGGNLDDYIHQGQVGTLLTPSTSANDLEGEILTTLSAVGVDPVAEEAASVVNSLDLGLDVTLGLDGTECSSQEQQQEFESYYFHTDVGPIPITLSDNISSTNSTPTIYSITSQSKSLSNREGSLFSDLKKKGGRKSKTKPSPTKAKVTSILKPKKVIKSAKSTTTPLPSSMSSPTPKLPKDSPFRYQRLKCPKSKCEKRFRTQWELTLHLGRIHAEFSCEFCSLIFTSNVEMVRHQYNTHNTELGYYTCKNCQRHFGSPRIVQEHVHSHHPEARVPSTSVALKWRRA